MDRKQAILLDAEDPLRAMRDEFHFPARCNDPEKKSIYLCGNSLGLQPKALQEVVNLELKEWQERGVEGHFHHREGVHPWVNVEDNVNPMMAKVVGAKEIEVNVMNGLTTNLHLLMMSFYRPTQTRFKIIMETKSFPSDLYAINSQIEMRGFDPEMARIEVCPREGESTLRTEDILATIRAHGDSVALVLFSGVQYYTGQFFDLETITKVGHEVGAMVGFDCAHAVGNVPLSLHDWDVDFAAWCSYKYLNAGPGGIGGVFVHERFAADNRQRLAGWWGHCRETRFAMSEPFQAMEGAKGFAHSNPPVLQTMSLYASLQVFEKAGGMQVLREKAEKLSRYFVGLLQERLTGKVRIFSPMEMAERGCQISLFIDNADQVFEAIQAQGVICDVRRPNVIRVAPTPLYNSFEDVWEFVDILVNVLS